MPRHILTQLFVLLVVACNIRLIRLWMGSAASIARPCGSLVVSSHRHWHLQYRVKGQHQMVVLVNGDNCWPEGMLGESDMISQVLAHSDELLAGKKLIVRHIGMGWKIASGDVETDELYTCPTDAMRFIVHRALRRMSKVLPGSAWTRDGIYYQVHLSNVQTFKSFCQSQMSDGQWHFNSV